MYDTEKKMSFNENKMILNSPYFSKHYRCTGTRYVKENLHEEFNIKFSSFSFFVRVYRGYEYIYAVCFVEKRL